MTMWPETRLSLIGRLADSEDVTAWQQFESSYQAAVYRYARSRGLHPDESMDVVQEVLVAVHKQAAKWVPSGRAGSFRAWLAEVARRITMQILRQRERIGRGTGGSSAFARLSETSKDDEQSEAEDRAWEFYCVAAVVERETNPIHWQAFWMTAIEGMNAEEVAAKLNMRSGSVYSAKCRVLTRLKRAIDQLRSQTTIPESNRASKGATS